jgi:hypothetical protein
MATLARRHYDDVVGASTLAGCAREFAGYPGPRLIAAAAVGTIAARVRMGRFGTELIAGTTRTRKTSSWSSSRCQ